MKNEKTMNRITMDAFCEQEAGSFQRFLKDKEAFLQAIENERKERIRAAQKASHDSGLGCLNLTPQPLTRKAHASAPFGISRQTFAM